MTLVLVQHTVRSVQLEDYLPPVVVVERAAQHPARVEAALDAYPEVERDARFGGGVRRDVVAAVRPMEDAAAPEVRLERFKVVRAGRAFHVRASGASTR